MFPTLSHSKNFQYNYKKHFKRAKNICKITQVSPETSQNSSYSQNVLPYLWENCISCLIKIGGYFGIFPLLYDSQQKVYKKSQNIYNRVWVHLICVIYFLDLFYMASVSKEVAYCPRFRKT